MDEIDDLTDTYLVVASASKRIPLPPLDGMHWRSLPRSRPPVVVRRDPHAEASGSPDIEVAFFGEPEPLLRLSDGQAICFARDLLANVGRC